MTTVCSNASTSSWARRSRVTHICTDQTRFLFFFQAEDGIRDHCVTGVQTCALPISSRRRHKRSLCDWSSDVCSSDLDYQSMPDIYLHIQAQAAFFSGLQAIKPLSIKGGIDAALVMSRIAQAMGDRKSVV